MFLNKNDSDVLKKHHQKEMLNIYRKALAAVSRMKLISLNVELQATFNNDGFMFEILVFNNDHNNKSFNFYEFQSLGDIKLSLNEALKAIKKDNFHKIEELPSY